MSTAQLAPPATSAGPPRLRLGWIIGPRHDLLWLIGGALGGYALFLMHAALAWDMFLVWAVWYVFLDIPHFFGTYARTYLDREELRRRRLLLFGSLGLLLVGPALLLVSCAMYHSGVAALAEHYELPYYLLLVFLSLWAYWHVVRQHYGILALYKRKNNDVAPPDQLVDKSLLYVGLLAPFAAFVLLHPVTRAYLGLPREHSAWESAAAAALAGSVAVIGLAFLARQAQLWLRGDPVNVPKILFLLAVVPLHVVVCYHPAMYAMDEAVVFLSFAAFVTVFHDIQYHAIVWHYQKNRYRRPGADARRYGPAALVGRHFAIYAACAVLLGVGAWVLGCWVLGIEPGCVPLLGMVDTQLFGAIQVRHFLTGVAIGLIMHHYFVDQFIWRTSKDAQLRQDLQVAAR
jgi:hypothetical protein